MTGSYSHEADSSSFRIGSSEYDAAAVAAAVVVVAEAFLSSMAGSFLKKQTVRNGLTRTNHVDALRVKWSIRKARSYRVRLR